jgi:hypothetical protein
VDKQLILSFVIVALCIVSIAMSYVGIQIDELNFYAYVAGLFVGIVGILSTALIVIKRGLI